MKASTSRNIPIGVLRLFFSICRRFCGEYKCRWLACEAYLDLWFVLWSVCLNGLFPRTAATRMWVLNKLQPRSSCGGIVATSRAIQAHVMLYFWQKTPKTNPLPSLTSVLLHYAVGLSASPLDDSACFPTDQQKKRARGNDKQRRETETTHLSGRFTQQPYARAWWQMQKKSCKYPSVWIFLKVFTVIYCALLRLLPVYMILTGFVSEYCCARKHVWCLTGVLWQRLIVAPSSLITVVKMRVTQHILWLKPGIKYTIQTILSILCFYRNVSKYQRFFRSDL